MINGRYIGESPELPGVMSYEAREMAAASMHNPPHPGEVLVEYLGGKSLRDAAAKIGIGQEHLARLIDGQADIDAKLSAKLARAFGTSMDLWTGLQVAFDVANLLVPASSSDQGRMVETLDRIAHAYSVRDPSTNLLVCVVSGVPGLHTQGESIEEVISHLADVLTLVRSEHTGEGRPAYEIDDGPLTPSQIAALKKDVEQHFPRGKLLSRNSLFMQAPALRS